MSSIHAKKYSQEEVEELLSQQRQICAEYADTKSESIYRL